MVYHTEVYLPKELLFPLPKILNLKWSRHAIEAARSDKYGGIIIFDEIKLDPSAVIEYSEEDGGRKVLLRMRYDKIYDISVVVLISDNLHLVKTVWLNDKRDKHSTLARWKYVAAPQEDMK